MANFSNTGVNEIPSTATVSPGVVDNSGALALKGIANVVDTVGDLFNTWAKNKQKEAGDKLLSGLSNDLIKLGQAVDQGAMSSLEARTRVRTMVSQAVSGSPGLTSEILKLSNNILSQSGLGKVIGDGSAAEKEFESRKKAAIEAGFIPMGASEEDIEKGINDYEKAKLASQRLELMQKELNVKSSQNSLEETIRSNQSKEAIKNYASANFTAFQNQMAAIASQFAEGKISSEEAQMSAQSIWTKVQTVAGAAAHAGGPFIEEVLRPFQSVMDVTMGVVSGKFSLDSAKTRLERIKTEAEIEALNDPDIKAILGLMRVLGPVASENHGVQSILMSAINNKDYLNKFAKGEVLTDPGDKRSRDAARAFFKIFENALNVQNGVGSAGKDFTEEEIKAGSEKLNYELAALLDRVGNVSNVDNPAQLNEVMEFLSGSPFGTYSSNNTNFMTPESENKLHSVITREYADKVLPLVDDELNAVIDVNMMSTDRGIIQRGVGEERRPGIAVRDLVSIEFTGSGVSFVPKTFEDQFENNAAIKSAERLNKDVAPIINRINKAVTHVLGHTDYRQIWESEFKNRIFPDTAPEVPETSSGVQDKGLEVPGTTTEVPETALEVPNTTPEVQEGDKMERKSNTSPNNDIKLLSDIWGKLYQSENSPSKKRSFVQHQSIKTDPAVIEAIDEVLPVFKGDNGVHNQDNLRKLLIATANHESMGGKILEQMGGGPARGAFQVEPATARDVVKNSGLIGPNAERILGKTKKEILKMSNEELSEYLKDHRVNAVFATAKYLQAAKAKNMIGELNGQY